MKIKPIPRLKLPTLLAVLGLSLAGSALRAADSGHWYAGALSTNQGGQLYFDWTPTGFAGLDAAHGFTYSMNYSNSGTYAGLFNIGNPTMTALAQTTANGGTPSANAAAFGSFIELSIVSVTGPAGGSLYFFSNSISPTFTLASGSTASSDIFQLSFGDSSAGPGADPYGHIHGRRWAVDLPGTYTVGVELFDGGHNGIGGGPIQAPSDIYYINFLAVPEPSTAALGLLGVMLGTVGLPFLRRKRRT